MRTKTSKILFILFIINCSLQIAEAQQPTEEWVRTYNSPDNTGEHFIGMAIDRYGNIFETSWNVASSAEQNNIITIKYNTNGTLQWAASYNGNGNPSDIARCLAVDSSGNCYVAGYSGFNFGPYDGILIKYNPIGDTIWTRKLITNLDDEFTNIAVDLNNFIYVTGRCGDSAVVFKYVSTGNLLWRTKYFQSQYLTLGGKILLDNANNIYVGGTKHIFSNPFSADFLVRKYTQNGLVLWESTYNNPSNVADWMTGFIIDNSGNSYATGYTSINGRDILTVKFNSGGVLQWAKYFNGTANANDQGNSIVCDTSGNNIYITGFTFVSGASRDYITIKYNSNGDTLWTRTYNGPGNYQDIAMDIVIDKNKNVYITGSSFITGTDFNVATIKYDLNGNQQWITRWGDGGDGGSKIKVDNQLNIYIGGGAGVPGPNFLDLLVIKYSQTVGITTINNEVPIVSRLFQNYPNPFNPKTVIKFQVASYRFIKLTVFDVIGREVATLVDEQLKAGTYEAVWDGSQYASGIYFYKLTVLNDMDLFTETKKMLLIK